MPGVPSITPTSAFNLAYNDYLNGKFDLAVSGFQRFIKDFPSTSLTPNAHYWLGESYYGQKDYIRAMQSFEHVVNEYAGNEKVPPHSSSLAYPRRKTGDTSQITEIPQAGHRGILHLRRSEARESEDGRNSMILDPLRRLPSADSSSIHTAGGVSSHGHSQ